MLPGFAREGLFNHAYGVIKQADAKNGERENSESVTGPQNKKGSGSKNWGLPLTLENLTGETERIIPENAFRGDRFSPDRREIFCKTLRISPTSKTSDMSDMWHVGREADCF